MVKRIVSLYLDIETVQRHKIAGTNISGVCDQFLKTYFEVEDEVQGRNIVQEVELLKVKLIKANALLETQKVKTKANDKKKQKERLTVSIIKLRELAMKKNNGSLIAREEYKALFDAAMVEFGLERSELGEKVF